MRKNIVKIITTLFFVALVVGLVPAEKVHAANTVSIQSCRINGDGTTVTAVATSSSVPGGDDGNYYLFAQQTFATSLGNSIATAGRAAAASFTFDLLEGTENSRLYQKFAVAVKSGGKFVQVSDFFYITNPEVIAKDQTPYPTVASKKGLMVSPTRLLTNEIEDIGVKFTTLSIRMSEILGTSIDPNYPTINYVYNGRNYEFNGLVVGQYDEYFKILKSKGVVVNCNILNDYDPNWVALLHPLSRDGFSCPYYMMNAADDVGVLYLSAVSSFLAERYSATSSYGTVSNWIIGNEVDAKDEWNYMKSSNVDTYTEEYAKAFRVCYNAIKSKSANARVYLSIDQTWDRNYNKAIGYDSKDFLDSFNRIISSRGNIDWSITVHPYPVPLTWSKFWDMPAAYKNQHLINNTVGTPMMNVTNVFILTDYVQQVQFRNPAGEVRHIIIDEIGFEQESNGETVQAAAIAYAYKIIENNQHIDQFVLTRDVDLPYEIDQKLKLGLMDMAGNHRQAYDVYKYIDTPQQAAYTDFAKSVIGISDWSQVITPR